MNTKMKQKMFEVAQLEIKEKNVGLILIIISMVYLYVIKMPHNTRFKEYEVVVFLYSSMCSCKLTSNRKNATSEILIKCLHQKIYFIFFFKFD